jgi:NADH:ubiquinone oxidoreductase subunit 6 (subunit J)
MRVRTLVDPGRADVIQRLGWGLVGIGVLVLIGWVVAWSVQGFFLEADIALIIRIAVGATAVGLAILFGLVVRDRLAAAKSEDFTEVLH